jgi:hypothetical protein
MAVEAIGAADSSRTTGRTEFQRFQQRLADDLAAKAAERVAAKEKAAVSESDVESLQARQSNGTTNADIGRIGSALDLVV